MATYRIGSMPHYRDGRLYRPGEECKIPDDVRPPRGSTPLDSKGREWNDPFWVAKAEAHARKKALARMVAKKKADAEVAALEAEADKQIAEAAKKAPAQQSGDGKPPMDTNPKGGRASDR